MSAKMQVSVTTVWQAYMDLESEGVIESRPKSGFFVRSNLRRLPPTPAPGANTPIEPRDLNRSELIGTVRDLVGRTDVLPFGVACPDLSLLPGRELSRIMASVLRDDPQRMMGYETVRGNMELQEADRFSVHRCRGICVA